MQVSVNRTSSIFQIKKMLVAVPIATATYEIRLISRVGSDMTLKITSAKANTVKFDMNVNVLRRLLRRSYIPNKVPSACVSTPATAPNSCD